MPDPILTGRYRVQAVFPGKSGFPEDRFVNSWGFFNLDLNNTPLSAATMFGRVLDAFYFAPQPGGQTIASYMSNKIDPTGVEYRAYDLGVGPPRDPIIVAPQATISFTTQPSIPEEVSVVMSLVGQNLGYDAQGNGVITPVPRQSRRGRLYLGPWGNSVVDETTRGVEIDPTLRATIADRANNILNSTENMSWDIISPTRIMSTKVIGGYVDDAFDTQRRRGLSAQVRTTFGAYTVS